MNYIRKEMCQTYRLSETECLQQILPEAKLSAEASIRIEANAAAIIASMRHNVRMNHGIDAFLQEYKLSSDEGVALMCLAEALLRIPDNDTADKLIADKISTAKWQEHLGQSNSYFINATTWALLLTGKITYRADHDSFLSKTLHSTLQRIGEPIIRVAVKHAMKLLGQQFVMGQTISEALIRAKPMEAKGYRYSYDMLGEESVTCAAANSYYDSYMNTIECIGRNNNSKNIYEAPGISIKLSALHPRYEWRKQEVVMQQLLPKLMNLALAAKQYNIALTIDAEEAERLDLSLNVFEKLISSPLLKGWNGLGLAVQAYQKRSLLVIDLIISLAKKYESRIMLRLVKGAYWDSEIKIAQERGLVGYPVFTRKAATDVCYIACVKKMFAAVDALYPQFATHNAYTVAVVIELAQGYKDFEFQCLHGMGDQLYEHIVNGKLFNFPCRVYAPVGEHYSLLAYLVRRLLENGANTSFVNRLVDENIEVGELLVDPSYKIMQAKCMPHPSIPLPVDLYQPSRPNSLGVDFTNPLEYTPVLHNIEQMANNYKFETIEPNNLKQVDDALKLASIAALQWSQQSVAHRTECLRRMAQLLEEHKFSLIALLVLEGHKTILDALSEVREAIDFCWYYSFRTSIDFATDILTGPTGESNQLQLHGRGVIACISPWNFPLAIFLGQCVAALLAGNAVVAKPAGQTQHLAVKAVELLHKAGIPKDVMQLLIGGGSTVGQAIINDLRVNGVMFTGSTEVARGINKTLANREGAIVPLIAETGGQNVMFVDSSALPEQVVKDVIVSAFGSAGQRCSSLRVLYLQEEVAEQIITMLCGAMAELLVSDPRYLDTDIGPVIDENAYNMLCTHRDLMKDCAKLLYEVSIDPTANIPNLFGPCAFEIDNISQLKGEVFGPILHIIRYKSNKLAEVIAQVNATGYGLTLGIHSRIEATADFIIEHAKVGNIYVNRNMIGAVVGVQPFGGEGLSGTGPKAGGPYYLPRLALERVVCINTAAAGGNASLVSLLE